MLKITRSPTVLQYRALGAGLYAPKRFTAVFEGNDWLTVAVRVSLTAEWNHDLFEYTVTQLVVDEIPDGDRVTSEVIREIPVGLLLRKATLRAILRGPHRTPPIFRLSIDVSDDEIERMVRQGPKPETLRLVAHFYTVAKIIGLPPADFVTRHLSLKPRTASYWIKLARERGYLKLDALPELRGKETELEFDELQRDGEDLSVGFESSR